jgi:hypothetical protein
VDRCRHNNLPLFIILAILALIAFFNYQRITSEKAAGEAPPGHAVTSGAPP